MNYFLTSALIVLIIVCSYTNRKNKRLQEKIKKDRNRYLETIKKLNNYNDHLKRQVMGLKGINKVY